MPSDPSVPHPDPAAVMPDISPPTIARRFPPTPVETSARKVRRFAPEPEETTTRSNRRRDGHAVEEPTPGGADNKNGTPPKRRFAPEPIEVSFKSNKSPVETSLPSPEPTATSISENPPAEETPKPRRRFAPQLIETCQRSKKAGDRRPATLPTDKTDLTPGIPNIYTRTKRKTARPPHIPASEPSENTPTSSAILPLPPHRQGSMRPHNNTRRSTRRDSFQPELEDIASEESERSSEDEDGENGWSVKDSTPSLTGSLGSSEDSMKRLQLARTRESCDERFSGYLLALAAKAAEKQLREQALAAFPNEAFHETVEHFYDREIDGASDEEIVETVGLLVDDAKLPEPRRKSTEAGWAVKEMQQHQEKLNRLREDETNQKIADEATKPTFPDPFWTNGMTTKAAVGGGEAPTGERKEEELERMRSAASPPMLGVDLDFRMCPSPKQTKLESDQRHDVQLHRCVDGGGLWGGYCIADEPGNVNASERCPLGIRTPHPEREDPGLSVLTNAPKSGDDDGDTMLAGIDDRLLAEEALSEEFNDTFVTQVYNYLSLGYPSLARQYDEELSRVSRITVEDLRADDHMKNAKGHIGLVDAPGVDSGKSKEHPKCPRWKALRVYTLEWGRQHPNISNGALDPSAWGVRAKRGSWAI